MSQGASLRQAMTVEVFLAWAAAQAGAWQLVDGEPVAMAPASDRHGRIQAEAARLLGNHLAAHRPECAVVTEGGIIPVADVRHDYRIPDLVVSCGVERSGSWAVPNPMLVIEILSPGQPAHTWRNVWAYTSIPSVRDILVLFTDSVRASLLCRDAQGGWPDQPVPIGAADVVALDSIGLALPLRDLYRTTSLAATG